MTFDEWVELVNSPEVQSDPINAIDQLDGLDRKMLYRDGGTVRANWIGPDPCNATPAF